MSDYSQVQNAVKTVFEKEGKIDLHFVNIEEISIEEFDKVIYVNIKGVFYMLKEGLIIMREQTMEISYL